jgi:hypothetical protein
MPLSYSSSIFKKSLMYLLQNDDRKKPARLRGAEAAHGHLKPKQFSKKQNKTKKRKQKTEIQRIGHGKKKLESPQ